MDFCDWMELRREKDLPRVSFKRESALAVARDPKGALDVHYRANQQAIAEPSDPFIRDRVISRCMNGSAFPSDFGLDFTEVKVVTNMTIAFLNAGLVEAQARGTIPGSPADTTTLLMPRNRYCL